MHIIELGHPPDISPQRFTGRVEGATFASRAIVSAIMSADQKPVTFVASGPARQSVSDFMRRARHLGQNEGLDVARPTDLPKLIRESEHSTIVHDPRGLWTFGSLIGIRTSLERPVPVICHHHSIDHPSLYLSLVHLLLSGAQAHDMIVCSSESARRAITIRMAEVVHWIAANWGIMLQFPVRLPVIPLPIDVASFDGDRKIVARRELGLPPDEVVMVCPGRMSHHFKADLMVVLRAFARVLGTLGGTRALLLFVGDDTEGYGRMVARFAASMGIGDSVEVHGRVNDMRPYYWASDLVVSVPDNIQESFGIVLIEAAAAGRPVVAADWDGYRDIVRHEETGLLVPTTWAEPQDDVSLWATLEMEVADDPNAARLALSQTVAVDEEALVCALTRLAHDSELRLQLGSRAKAMARTRYDTRVVGEALSKAFLESVEIATDCPSTPALALIPKYTPAFAHYPTRMLQPHDEVVWVDERQGIVPLLINAYGLDYLVSPSLCTLIRELTKTPTRVQDISDELVSRYERGSVTTHIMWCLKHGILRHVH